MSVFTRVELPDLAGLLRDYRLGDARSLAGVSSGIENTNYFLTTDTGHFVLTVFETVSPDGARFALELTAHLAARGLPVAEPMRGPDGYLTTLQGKLAAVVRRLPGLSIENPDATHCATIGALLAAMHDAAESFGMVRDNPRGAPWRERTARAVLPRLEASQRALLEDEIAFQRNAHLYRNLPRGTVHADLFRDNALFEGPRLVGVIDFYYACTDHYVFDLAVTVNDWCTTGDGALDAGRAAALIAAYRRRRPATTGEEGAWPHALRLAALRFWLSRLYDLHFPRDGQVVRVHNPEVFQRILIQHRSRPDAARAIWRSAA